MKKLITYLFLMFIISNSCNSQNKTIDYDKVQAKFYQTKKKNHVIDIPSIHKIGKIDDSLKLVNPLTINVLGDKIFVALLLGNKIEEYEKLVLKNYPLDSIINSNIVSIINFFPSNSLIIKELPFMETSNIEADYFRFFIYNDLIYEESSNLKLFSKSSLNEITKNIRLEPYQLCNLYYLFWKKYELSESVYFANNELVTNERLKEYENIIAKFGSIEKIEKIIDGFYSNVNIKNSNIIISKAQIQNLLINKALNMLMVNTSKPELNKFHNEFINASNILSNTQKNYFSLLNASSDVSNAGKVLEKISESELENMTLKMTFVQMENLINLLSKTKLGAAEISKLEKMKKLNLAKDMETEVTQNAQISIVERYKCLKKILEILPKNTIMSNKFIEYRVNENLTISDISYNFSVTSLEKEKINRIITNLVVEKPCISNGFVSNIKEKFSLNYKFSNHL